MIAASAAVRVVAAVCPAAPPGVQTYSDEVLSWVKWAVLAIMAISFFASVGMLVWGRVTHHPKGARLGFDGLMICLVAAIIYVVGYVIISSITGIGLLMTRGHGRHGDRRAATSWSRPRMLALLAGSVVVALLLVAGLVVATWSALQPAHHDSPRTTRPGHGCAEHRDVRTTHRVRRPCCSTVRAGGRGCAGRSRDADRGSGRRRNQDRLHPRPRGTDRAAQPDIDRTGSGADGLPPDIAAGALAQMAAIDATALQSGSLQGARAVITAWALPGGPTASSWSGVAALAQFFDAAGLSGGGSAAAGADPHPVDGTDQGQRRARLRDPVRGLRSRRDPERHRSGRDRRLRTHGLDP